MKQADYRQWLEDQKYEANTISTRMSDTARVEKFHGDLDEHYARDRMANLIDTLKYSRDDQRKNRPDPSKIPFKGDIHNN